MNRIILGLGILGVLFPIAVSYDLQEAGACIIAGVLFIFNK